MWNIAPTAKHLFNPFKRELKTIRHNYLSKTLIELRLELSFSTNFQVAFFDEEGSPKIKELTGNHFEKQIQLVSELHSLRFKAFVSNARQLKDQVIKMSLFKNGILLKELERSINYTDKYDGWFCIDA